MPYLIFGEWGYETPATEFALIALNKDDAEAALSSCNSAIADVRHYHNEGGYSADLKKTTLGTPERDSVIAKSCAMYDEAKRRLIALGVSPESNAHLCDKFEIVEVGLFPLPTAIEGRE